MKNRRRNFKNTVYQAKKRHSSPHAEKMLEGLFRATTHGYGFLETDGEEDLFIPASETLGALDGDTVRVAVKSSFGYDRTKKSEARVIKITKERDPYIVGIVQSFPQNTPKRTVNRLSSSERAPRFILIPDNPRLTIRPFVGGEDLHDGDKILAFLTDRPFRKSPKCYCRLINNFGSADSKEANYLAILAECDIPVDFEKEAIAEAATLASAPLSLTGRVRQKGKIFTIDGADAKDLDDAVSIKRLPDGHFELGVHIADVSSYVLPHTALDRAAMTRGTSLYFVDQVVPMLPPSLSNGACSLNAGEDKYALSAIMTIDDCGNILNVKLEKSIICSSVRGVYSEVNDLLSLGKESSHYEKYKEVYPSLRLMKKLYETVHRHRRQGMLELDRPEAVIKLNQEGRPVDILRRERGLAERMIEECMLLANEAVALALQKSNRPCVYRVHGAPDDEKVESFVTFAHNRGLDTSKIKAPYESHQFNAVLEKAQEIGIADSVSYLLLRTMEKARYSETPAAHFGIGLQFYCHFTSPIRRLSDLATHRIISEMLGATNEPSRLGNYAHRAAESASMTELRALQAERRIESLYKTIYLSDRIGEIYEARISSVTSFGIFAELENTCEGLVPIEELGNFITFNEDIREIEADGHCYRIGDLLTVRVESADISTSKVTFSIVKRETDRPCLSMSKQRHKR